MSHEQWRGGANCGKTILVCHEGRCTNVLVVDECMGCDVGSLDLSPRAFKAMAPLSEGVIPIHWSFV